MKVLYLSERKDTFHTNDVSARLLLHKYYTAIEKYYRNVEQIPLENVLNSYDDIS